MTRPYREQPVWFATGDEMLFGIATETNEPATGIQVLTICGGGWIPSFHRGSMWVRLARELAAKGYRTFRFDYHGVGESTGSVQFALDQPLVGDARAALTAFGDGSMTVLVGTCGGARTAAALGTTVDDLAGVALMAVPVRTKRTTTDVVRAAFTRKVLRNLRDAEARRLYAGIAVRRIRALLGIRTRSADGSRNRHNFYEDLAALIERRVPILMAYGERDREYRWFQEAAAEGELKRLLDRAGDLVQVVVVDQTFHGFHSAGSQQNVIDVVRDWLESRIRPSLSPADLEA